MRKFLIFFSLSVFLFVAVITNVKAQTEEEKYDYQRAYQDYVFTKDQYTKVYSDYRLARSQYLQADTLVSEGQAREKTTLMLQARDDVIITYLSAVRYRLDEAVGVGDAIKSGLLVRLAAEITWFESHKSQITGASTLDDLVADSTKAFEHFADTERLVYETLIVISNGKVNVLRTELTNILTETRKKTFEISTNGDHDVEIVLRWLDEIDEKVTRSLDKSIEAETSVQELYGKGGKKSGKRFDTFNEASSVLQQSLALLRDGNSFMKEIIKAITLI